MVEYDANLPYELYELDNLNFIGCNEECKQFCQTYYQSGPFTSLCDIYQYLKKTYNIHQNRIDIHIEKLNREHQPILPKIGGFSLIYRNYVFKNYFSDTNDIPTSMTRLTDEKFNEFDIHTWQTRNPMTLDAVMFLYDFLIARKKNNLPPEFYCNGQFMTGSAALFKEYQKKKWFDNK